MAIDYLNAPGSVQPANLTRYTECLTSPGLLGQGGHAASSSAYWARREFGRSLQYNWGQARATSTGGASIVA